MNRQAEAIAHALSEARADTLKLFDICDERDLHESPGFGYRPVIWHLAHIGVFEAYWLVQKAQGLSAPDARYERVFVALPLPSSKSVRRASPAAARSTISRELRAKISASARVR